MFVSKVCRYNYVRALRAVHSCAGKLSEDVEGVFKKFGDDVYYYDDNRGNCRRLIYGVKTDAYMMARAEKRSRKEDKFPNPLPLSLRLVAPGYEEERPLETRNKLTEEAPKKWQFPFEASNAGKIEPVQHTVSPSRDNLDELGLEIRTRLELHNKSPEHTAWMDDYENYSGPPTSTVEASVNYGTPDPKSAITATPCGGCGALLHCKDPAIPGYIPSEILGNFNRPGGLGLKELVCQRCHFLKTYDLALQVRVTAEDYPKVLRTIGEQHRALVLLIVDLLDFPCSIWPGIPDLIGHNRPIIAVGNKVDLLPQDDKKFLERVGRNLRDSLALSGFGTCNVKHVALVSAKTGYGIEDLITRLHSLWQYKGDVYIVGCTNVGKSTLFNALLQSDYCKSQAADLIQRATTSPWPGTTLNLLKFPILRPTGWRMHLRAQRLSAVRSLESKQRKLHLEQMKNNKDLSQATLIGHIGHTFMEQRDEEEEESEGYFAKARPTKKKFGIDEKHPDYATSKWCYDTPGVVQENQVIHLLTTEELMLMLPKEIIRPKTFTLYSNSTIFIGGVARLDVLETSSSVRFTVFCSDKLPITVCATSKAEAIYDRLLDADALAVPTSHPDRLRVWPGLRPARPFTVAGVDSNTSCCDVVLSNAGWIAVTPGRDQKCTVRGWTPERRGVHLRDSLLPKAVALRGDRIRRTCAYANNKFFVP